MKRIMLITVVGILLVSQMTLAQDYELENLQKKWAIANYQLKEKSQDQAFQDLLKNSEAAVREHPQAAEYWIWDGIIKSSYAGVKGGLGALAYVKASRKSLEKALQIDDDALQGSAYTSLGVLYYKSPGWPLSFGDKNKARKLLLQALAINPDGIDPNYFYGEFLLEQGEYEQAKQHLLMARKAAPRPGRPVADRGRQEEITEQLQTLAKKAPSVYAAPR